MNQAKKLHHCRQSRHRKSSAIVIGGYLLTIVGVMVRMAFSIVHVLLLFIAGTSRDSVDAGYQESRPNMFPDEPWLNPDPRDSVLGSGDRDKELEI